MTTERFNNWGMGQRFLCCPVGNTPSDAASYPFTLTSTDLTLLLALSTCREAATPSWTVARRARRWRA